MERIRQAVEQAARDRQQRAPGSLKQADATSRFNTSTASNPAVSTTKVSYTQTRTTNVSQEVLAHHRIVAAIPGHPVQDTYKMLRTRILQTMLTEGWNSIAITSPSSGCGKTLTAINLAVSLAMDVSHTALLVDGDLRHPSIHRYFDYVPAAGIGDYLFNDAPLADVLFHPGVERLTVLPGREAIYNSAETLRSPKMVSLVNELRGRYADRITIVDMPPVLAVDDALVFAPYVDCVLIVAESGTTTREDLRKALEVFSDIPVVGTVLNKADTTALAY